MGIKKYKPTSASRRLTTVSDFADITRDRPEKSLTEAMKRSGGRNVHGHITRRHQGGGEAEEAALHTAAAFALTSVPHSGQRSGVARRS